MPSLFRLGTVRRQEYDVTYTGEPGDLVIRTNKLIFSLFVLSMIFNIYMLSGLVEEIDSWFFLCFTLPIPILWLICFFLNYLGWYRSSLYLTFTTLNVITVGWVITFGRETNSEHFLFCICLAPTLLSRNRFSENIYWSAISVICYLWIQWGPLPGPLVVLDDGFIWRSRLSNSVVLFLCMGLICYIFSEQQHHLFVKLTEARSSNMRFIATMSHEIRTPLTSIIGLTDLLMENDLPKRQKHFLQMIHSAEENLLHIVNNILDFAKIEANKLVMDPVEFDLIEFVEETVAMFAIFAQNKGLELVTEIDPTLVVSSPKFIGDSKRLRQILWNLISNSIKFTDKGHIVVKVEVDSENLTNPSIPVIFQIIDTGIGMDLATQKKLFNEYFQANSTFRTHGGTGLGLSISKRLIDLMGGDISLTSKVGEGTTFKFHVKFQPAPSFTQISLLDSKPFVNKTAIVVGCQGKNRTLEFLEHLLGLWGFQLEVIILQQEKEELLSQIKPGFMNPHLVIFDYSQQFGANFHERLNLDKKKTKVLALMRFASKPLTDDTFIHDIVALPIRARQLKSTVESLFEEKEQEKEQEENEKEKETIKVCGPELTKAPGFSPQPISVLLAEDNVINQQVMVELLNRLNVHCDVVENGAQAVDAVTTKNYDLVFMDKYMPEMNGDEATESIRRWEKSQETKKHTPIVALTGSVTADDERTCLKAGMDSFLSKPVRLKDLADCLRMWTTRKDN